MLFPGYTLTAQDIAQTLSFATGTKIHARQMSWLPIQAAQPFWPMARHLLEMRYLWQRPHSIDPSGFETLLPDFRETPVDIALLRASQHKIRPDKPMSRHAVRLATS